MIRCKKWMLASVVLLAAAVLRADTLWIGDTMKDAVKVDGLKVKDANGETLTYMTDAGLNGTKAFAKLQQINVEGETNFNSAEQAFTARDFDTAISAYQTVLQSSTAADWMLTRSALRLLAAAKAKNRYDAQVSAYVTLLQKNPTLAAANVPGEPPEHSQYLDAALTAIGKGLDNSKLEATQKGTLLSLQLRIDQAKADKSATLATLQQLNALGGTSDALKPTLKLAEAEVAMDNKEYPKAIAAIEQNKAVFTELNQQVDALFILAQAKFAVDGEKTDADALKDLALNYMRVVTFGSQLNDRPHVAESLYQAGVIEEKLKDPTAAQQFYSQVSKDRAYANSPFKPKADAALERLKGAK